MATLGLLAVLASLFPAAQCLELQLRRQLGVRREDPLEVLKALRNSVTKKRSSSGPLRTPPPYTEATGYGNATHCLVSHEFMIGNLSTEFPEHDFADSPLGLELSDVMGVDDCASMCAQITGCTLFSAAPDQLCFLYSTCTIPRNLGPPYALYTFVSSQGDPHLRNLAGEKFDVNQPDDYLLLRVPREPTQPALLAMRGSVMEAEDAPCALYMKEVTLSGEWLGSKQVRVRSLKGKSFQGTWPDGWPFAMMTSSTSPESEGQWMSWESLNLTAGDDKAASVPELPSTIAVTTIFREEEAAAGRVMEAQAFEFRVGTQIAQERASILVAQGSHEGLDIFLSKMSMLHEPNLGGLLGTEKHDKKVEVRTESCKSARGAQSRALAPATAAGPAASPALGSFFAASWA